MVATEAWQVAAKVVTTAGPSSAVAKAAKKAAATGAKMVVRKGV